MTVPVQRGGSDDPTVTNLILSAIDDLKNGFVRLEERITQRVEEQAKQFVPRGEYEARHSDVRNQITKLDGRVDAEVAKLDSRVDAEVAKVSARIDAEASERKALENGLTARLDAAEQARVSGRWRALGFAATLALIVIGLLSLILANLH